VTRFRLGLSFGCFSRSFDSRYFGPLPITTIIGRAIPVWTTGAADPAAEFLRAPVSDEP